MKRYTSIFLEQEQERQLHKEYIVFCRYAKLLEAGKLEEFAIPGFIKDKIDFIKGLAQEIGKDFMGILKIFLNKNVYKFFSLIKWSLDKLFDIVKAGYKVYNTLIQAIKDFIEESGITKWTDEALRQLDEFLQRHPKIKKLSGYALGALIIAIWWNMTFTGNVDYDFSFDMLFDAVLGKIGFADVFGGADGLILMSLLVAKVFYKVTFPWPGPSSVQFIFAVLYTLGKKIHAKVFAKDKIKSVKAIPG